MKRYLLNRVFFSALMVVLLPFLIYAQETDVEKNKARLMELLGDTSMLAATPSGGASSGEALDIRPGAPCDCQLDSATYQAYLTSLQRYYYYRIHGFDHRQRVFEWQHASTRIIFIVVIVLVLAGIYFAAVQFHHGMKYRKPGDAEEGATEFVASFKGVKVKSPVLGVIILVISLVFFYLYLYLIYVYPIVNVF